VQHSIEEIRNFSVFIASGRAPGGRFRSTVEPAKIS